MKAAHPIAGALALLIIVTFWLSTVVSELSGSIPVIVAIKTAIPWGFLVLIPAIATAGISGFRSASGRSGKLIQNKRRRMPIIAVNGILVLIPSALFLAEEARGGQFGIAFYTVQAIELCAGGLNIALMLLNIRDGMRMKPRSRNK